MTTNMPGTVAACRACYNDQAGMACKLKRLPFMPLTCGVPQKLDFRLYPNDRHWQTNGKSHRSLVRQSCTVQCYFYGSRHSSETKECESSEDSTDACRDFKQYSRGNDHILSKKKTYASQGWTEACKFVYNDAKFVNERAQSDILLLSWGITRLNKRACQDVAVLGLGFLNLDARARKDTQKIDHSVKERAARLNHLARVLKERAESDLKKAADNHWSDGALEADLWRADLVVKRRAMEDAFMALKFVRDIHDMMVNRLYEQLPKDGSSHTNSTDFVTLEKNGKTRDLFPGDISADQIAAIEEAYWSMASAFSEADGVDYTDPDELELLVATLIDLDAMDGKKECFLDS